MLRIARLGALVVTALLSACAGRSPAPAPETPSVAKVIPPPVVDALTTGIRAGPALATLPAGPRGYAPALAAFRASCPALLKRSDASRLTRREDWRPACAAAPGWPDGDAQGFFARWFETASVGDGRLFATGYFEPEIAGARERRPGYDTPVYVRPPDLAEADLGRWSGALKGRTIRGRVDGGRFVPYPDRAAIEDGALAGKGLELAWAADPIDLFFLEIQGSGRLRLPDGGVMRIGYDGQNGRDYVAIGKLMKDRGLLAPGQASMQGIVAWLRANPVPGRAIMRENGSYVFFREVTGPGPAGALGVAVTGGASVAADPRFVPLGAPILLDADRAEATGPWVAQDTGGAIKGANRVDTFWGAGEAAKATAGGMSAHGAAWLLLPVGTVARLAGEAGAATGGTGDDPAPPRP